MEVLRKCRAWCLPEKEIHSINSGYNVVSWPLINCSISRQRSKDGKFQEIVLSSVMSSTRSALSRKLMERISVLGVKLT